MNTWSPGSLLSISSSISPGSPQYGHSTVASMDLSTLPVTGGARRSESTLHERALYDPVVFRPRIPDRRILACVLAATVSAAPTAVRAQGTTDDPDVRGYGDQGTSEISLHLGAGNNYFAA